MDIDNFYLIEQRYHNQISNICDKYRYSSNLCHLYYIMIPIFLIKYGIKKERLILNVFSSTSIIIKDNQDKIHQAFYTSIPVKINGKITTKKIIVLNNYKDISLVQLLDNLIHEYNHAINSSEKEIIVKDNILYLRTGLTYSKYDYSSLKPLEKEKSFVLEEILNAEETEDMINLIRDINIDRIDDILLKNTISSIQSELPSVYKTGAYNFQKGVCKYLLDNKTFTSTLNSLRITGDIIDIDKWFDNITNIDGSYHNLVTLLEEILDLESKLPSLKIKYFTLRKIKNKTFKLIDITKIFNENCTYK